MKYAVIYARYSCERQTEQSIEGQLRICEKYAEDNGLKIVESYIDRATTGTNDNRPAFQKMLSDCEKALWDIVLVYAIDRFGRNSIEIALNKQKLKKNHKMLISATQRTSENIDGTKNLDGILLENMYIGLAEYYSAELSQKIRRGLHENRVKGYYSGGIIPYGYYVEKKKVYIKEDEATIVRQIFQYYVQGITVKEILQNLAEKGIAYKGRPFAMNTVYQMLRLEKYIGICRYDEGVYDNIFPAIVPKQLFDDVKAILAKNKIGSRSVQTDFLLKGKLICGLCGKNMHGESGTSHTGKISHYYKCMARKRDRSCTKSTLPKDKFDKLILDVTIQLLSDQDQLNRIADGIMRAYEKKMKDTSVLSLLENERKETRRALENIMKAIESGIFNTTTQTRMNELEKQLADIEDKIELEKYNEQKILTKEKVMAYLTNAILKKPKTLIHTLIQKIIVYEDKVEIFYNYTDETNPGDDSPRDLSYWLGSDNSAIPGSPDCSGSDSSVIQGSNPTNPNQNEKNYPKGSDSSVMVEINGLEPSTS